MELRGRRVKSLVRREDDGRVRGPQRPRGRPKQCRAQERGLDEGGGPRRVTQSQRVGCQRAQSRLGEGAGQEAGRQALGQMLLQGQFGLERTGRGEGGEREEEVREEQREDRACLLGKHDFQTCGLCLDS